MAKNKNEEPDPIYAIPGEIVVDVETRRLTTFIDHPYKVKNDDAMMQLMDSIKKNGINYQKTGKELVSKDELAVMDGGKCILQLRSVRPFFSDKFDIIRHKRYVELSDSNEKLAFDIEKFVSRRLVLKKNEEIEIFEADVLEEEITEITE